jgi:hypothetical protein
MRFVRDVTAWVEANTWVRRGGTWQCVATQETRVP